MNPTSPMRLCLLFFLSLIVVGKDSTLSDSSQEQTPLSPSTMTLEQSAEWLRKTFWGLGKQRLLLNSDSSSGGLACDVTCTFVSFDRASLTLAFTEDCKLAENSWTQKYKFIIPLDGVDSQRISVQEVRPENEGQLATAANILHIVMSKGLTSQTSQVLIENGKAETKDFEDPDTLIYFPSKAKARQTAEVLRRMVELVSKRN